MTDYDDLETMNQCLDSMYWRQQKISGELESRVRELENDISIIIGMLSELRVGVYEKNKMAYEYGLEVYKKTSLFKELDKPT